MTLKVGDRVTALIKGKQTEQAEVLVINRGQVRLRLADSSSLRGRALLYRPRAAW